MFRHKLLRLAKFSTFLLLIALWASAAPIDARVETDNGILRVKSAVSMTEAITRIEADIATQFKMATKVVQSITSTVITR
jgi:hypothetical protein